MNIFFDIFCGGPEESEHAASKRRLNEWVRRAEGRYEQEKHQRAAERMLQAYNNKETAKLDFYRLDLNNMPPGVETLTHLQELDLEFNNFSPFPSEIESLINLQTLKMAGNRLPAIPPQIGKFVNLIELDLKDNWLTVLPNEIGMLTNLRRLKLHNNRLTALPTEIAHLTNLEELSLFHNRLEELPLEIEKLVKLQKLYLDDNKFVFPPEIKTLTNLKELTLGNNKLQYISPKIERQANLEWLYLSNNQLTTLPTEIGKLTKLSNLSLEGNRFIALLSEIGQLANLQKLFLGNNKIKFLPPAVEQLTNLKYLGLKENGLALLPPKIGNLTLLVYLELDGNKLTALPTEIGKLTKLEQLRASNNQLTALPSEIGNLFNLKELYIHNNPYLGSLPMTLGNCSQILNLDLGGCPEFLERQGAAILARTEALRKGGGVLMLPVRLATWKSYGGFKGDLTFLSKAEKFTAEQQCQIGELLLRLERCKDFQSKRGELANLVCKILSDLGNSSAFKEAFFAKLGGNLSDCGDRASMLLNMIYTDWKLCVERPGATDQQKLELLSALAKTLTLRETLEQMVAAYEAKNKTILHESVECFLYYEIRCRKELGLLTAVENMSHAVIGKAPDVIDEKALIKAVNENFLNTLCNFDELEKILEKFPDYTKERADIKKSAEQELAQLEEKNLKDQEFLERVKFVTAQREKKLADLKKKFLNK